MSLQLLEHATRAAVEGGASPEDVARTVAKGLGLRLAVSEEDGAAVLRGSGHAIRVQRVPLKPATVVRLGEK